MDSFASNYIKIPRSNLTNKNASIITNTRQTHTIITGYKTQIKAIEHKLVSRPATMLYSYNTNIISSQYASCPIPYSIQK